MERGNKQLHAEYWQFSIDRMCYMEKRDKSALWFLQIKFCFVLLVDTLKVLYLFYKSYFVFFFRHFPTYDWLETRFTATVKWFGSKNSTTETEKSSKVAISDVFTMFIGPTRDKKRQSGFLVRWCLEASVSSHSVIKVIFEVKINFRHNVKEKIASSDGVGQIFIISKL